MMSKSELAKLIADVTAAVVARLDHSQPAAQSAASVRAPRATAAARAPVSRAPVPVRNIPHDGDFYSHVGQPTTAGRDVPTRIKTPRGLFDSLTGGSFEKIVLNMPWGESVVIEANAHDRTRNEAPRGRLNDAMIQALKVRPGQFIVYSRVQDGIFDVSVSGKADAGRVARVAATAPVIAPVKAGRASVVVPVADSALDVFDVPAGRGKRVRVASAAPVAASNGKRPRSAAQLANDAKLRAQAAAKRAAGVPFFGGVVPAAPAGKGRRTGKAGTHVAAPVTAAQSRTERKRAANHTQAAQSQTAYAQTHTRAGVKRAGYQVPAVAAVPVKSK